MAQTIVVPSGDRLEFPDGMADADIEKAIFAEYPDMVPKKPGVMSRIGDAMKPAEREPMPSAADMINDPWTSASIPREETISVKGSVMDGRPVSKLETDQGAVDTLGVPVTREFQARVRRQMDAMTPEQRQAMAELPDMRGRVAKEILRQYQTLDQSAEGFAGHPSPVIKGIDTRREQRSAELARQGVHEDYRDNLATSDALQGAGKMRDSVSASDFDFEAQDPGLRRAWRDWESGVVGSTGATLAYAGRKSGVQALADIGDSMDRWAKGKLPANPTFADELVAAFGSSGSFLIPGIGVARGAEALAILSQTAAKWAGAGTMAALEAAAESDGVYKELVQRGVSEQDAMDKADGVFWKNMAVLGVTDKIAFFNDMKAAKTALGRFSQQARVAAPTESVQEGAQQVISNEATDKPLAEGVPSSMAIGGIVGGVSGGIHGAMQPQRASAGDRLAQRLYQNVEGAAFDPAGIDAAVRQSLSPDAAQLRRVSPVPTTPPAAPSARAELEAILNDKRPVEEILAETQNRQSEASGWPAPNTPVVAKLPDGQVISGQIQRVDNGAARFIARDGEVWVFNPGEAEITAASGDGTRAAPVKAETADDVKIAEQAVDTNPTPAQKEAGNYRLGHLQLQGMDIAIETPAGATRAGVDRAGKPWSVTMNHTYGYIKGAEAKDGDKLDAFIGPNPQSPAVYVIDQIDPKTGNYDEAKVMLGFSSADEARAAYLSNYEQGWQGLGAITPMHVDAFKAWIAKGDTRKALAYDQKAATEKRNADTVRELALEEQRKAGWNSAWPFIPADLGNNDFRDLIRKDPAISAEEKEAIFAAGKNLGVIPKGEKATKPAAPVQTADTLPRSPQPGPEAAGLISQSATEQSAATIAPETSITYTKSALTESDGDIVITKGDSVMITYKKAEKLLAEKQELRDKLMRFVECVNGR